MTIQGDRLLGHCECCTETWLINFQSSVLMFLLTLIGTISEIFLDASFSYSLNCVELNFNKRPNNSIILYQFVVRG